MRTITLEYDYYNTQAQNALNYILSLGLFNPTVEEKKENLSEKRKKLDHALKNYMIDLSTFKFNREEANVYE